MSAISNPNALEARVREALEMIGELSAFEISEIRAHQTALAQSLVDDLEGTIREHRKEAMYRADDIKCKAESILTRARELPHGQTDAEVEQRSRAIHHLELMMANSPSTTNMADVIEQRLREYAFQLTHRPPI